MASVAYGCGLWIGGAESAPQGDEARLVTLHVAPPGQVQPTGGLRPLCRRVLEVGVHHRVTQIRVQVATFVREELQGVGDRESAGGARLGDHRRGVVHPSATSCCQS
jgi:hypothetical protein